MGKLNWLRKAADWLAFLLLSETCYECGKQFMPGPDTPLRTIGWDYDFCSDGCKADYRRSRE